MILGRVMLIMCVAATALWPLAASGQDPFKTLELIKPARTRAANDFTVASPDGKQVRLGDHRGKVVFLNFWATWCPPCREEIPAMEWLYQRYRDKGFTVIAISVDSDIVAVPSFIKENQLTFPIGPRAWDTNPAYAVIETFLNSMQCGEAQPSYPIASTACGASLVRC